MHLLATDVAAPVNGVVRTWETGTTIAETGHEVEDSPRPVRQSAGAVLPKSASRSVAAAGAARPPVGRRSGHGGANRLAAAPLPPHRWRFSTSYHSKFPEYLQHLARVPTGWTYRFMRWFHSGSSAVMVSTPTLEADLAARGFRNLCRWSRGVDLTLFAPRPKTWTERRRPILLYAGRVSKEKNLDAFLALNHAGTKVVVGDGPMRDKWQRQHPEIVFLGYRTGPALAEAYANADVFVFPSKTDTFGLVMIEAMACGVPVAAYPVVGPIDVVTNPNVGCLDDNLGRAVEVAQKTGDPAACVAHARQFTWERCTDQLLANFVPIRDAVKT